MRDNLGYKSLRQRSKCGTGKCTTNNVGIRKVKDQTAVLKNTERLKMHDR